MDCTQDEQRDDFPNIDAARNANEKNVVIALATKNEQPQGAELNG